MLMLFGAGKTVTLHEPETPFFATRVILADPSVLAVTSPVLLIVAISLLLLIHV